MAISLLRLPVAPSPLQSFMGGFAGGEDLAAQQERNQLLATQNKYLPQQLQNASKLALAKAQLAQYQMQFQPQLDQARLMGLQANANLAGVRAQDTPMLDQLRMQNLQSMLPLNQQRLQNLQQENVLAPQRLALQEQQLKNSQNRFSSQAYQLSKTLQNLSPAAKAAYVANHPQQFIAMANSYLPPGNMNLSPQDIQTANEVQRASQLEANKDVTTAATRRQQEGGTQVMTMINSPQFDQGLQAYAQYAGILGKGKQAVDAWTNSNKNQYNLANNFRNAFIPLLKNRIKSLDQVGGTDAQRQELENILTKASDEWSSNPQRAIASFNLIKETLNQIDKSVNASGNKIFNVPTSLGTNTQIGTSGSPMLSTGRIVIVKNGKKFTVPASQLNDALQQGYKRG